VRLRTWLYLSAPPVSGINDDRRSGKRDGSALEWLMGIYEFSVIFRGQVEVVVEI
jgi:hypothetical protein